MGFLRRRVLLKTFMLSDLLIVSFSFFLSKFTTTSNFIFPSWNQIAQIEIKINNALFFMAFLLTWHLCLKNMGLYKSKRLSKIKQEIVDIIKSTALGSVLMYVGALIFKINFLTPVFFITFWTISLTIIILTRFILRFGLKKIRLRGRNLRRILIVGSNQRAIEFAKNILSTPELGYRLIGFVDSRCCEAEKFKKEKFELICDLNNFLDFIRENVVDEVVLALPVRSFYEEAEKIVFACEVQGIIVRYLSNIYETKKFHLKNENFDDYSSIKLYSGAKELDGWPLIIKRTLDILISLLLLILSIPIFLFASIGIKISSSGTIFFVQERIGLNKRRFSLLKFRTMIQGAEKKQSELERLNEVTGPIFKIKNDPRITKFGSFLRKSSIDELPQLLNVLLGHMSLVGPRPLPIRDYKGFREDWHRRRFSVRPGLTCLWQINGRSNVPFENWMELDMEYIDHWSLILDLKILFKTVPAVIRGYGAS